MVSCWVKRGNLLSLLLYRVTRKILCNIQFQSQLKFAKNQTYTAAIAFHFQNVKAKMQPKVLFMRAYKLFLRA